MHVTIIAKSPAAGRVKTRLCPPCTFEQAAQVAHAGLLDTIDEVDRVAAATGAERVLLWAGERPSRIPSGFRMVAQRGDGLGQRLANGFRDLGSGVIIGMETPHVAAWLAEALAMAVAGIDTIGLAVDGGYWMIGLGEASAARAEEVFDGVPMSVSSTGVAQLRRLHSLRRRVRLLPVARDLDTFSDLVALAGSGRAGRLAELARRLCADL